MLPRGDAPFVVILGQVTLHRFFRSFMTNATPDPDRFEPSSELNSVPDEVQEPEGDQNHPNQEEEQQIPSAAHSAPESSTPEASLREIETHLENTSIQGLYIHTDLQVFYLYLDRIRATGQKHRRNIQILRRTQHQKRGSPVKNCKSLV